MSYSSRYFFEVIFLGSCFYNIEIIFAVTTCTNEYIENNNNLSTNIKYVSEDVYQNLPNSTYPTHYSLELEVNMKSLTFAGTLSLKAEAEAGTKHVILHSKDLNITSLCVCNYGSPMYNNYTVNKENELLLINVNNHNSYPLSLSIIINYNGRINTNRENGFYVDYYKEGNLTQMVALTKFRYNHAREVFPCFDEPRFKAPFSLKIQHHSNYSAISNMKKQHTNTYHSDLVSVKFLETLPISTHSVAFVLTQFSNKFNKGKIITWTLEDVITKGYANYSVDIGQIFLTTMENYTNVTYPLSEINFIGIPHLSLGSIGYWGLVTFKEYFMLYNKETDNIWKKLLVTSEIAHQIAHQWFANYVTCLKWDYVWLHEALSTYFENKLIDEIYPTWRIMEMFTIRYMHIAMKEDGVTKFHAMTRSPSHKNINDMADIITYNKGASIVRMMEYLTTPRLFKKSLTRYLNSKCNKCEGVSVTPTDLWTAFQKELSFENHPLTSTFGKIMESWTTQIGYPLVTVSINSNSTITIQQEVYVPDNENHPIINDWYLNQTWHIPVTFISKSSTYLNKFQSIYWLSNKRSILTYYALPTTDDWILLNREQQGYYRVNYDTKNWFKLIKQLENDQEKINLYNRIQLIDDAFTLAGDDKLSYTVPLMLITSLSKEMDIIPLEPAIKHMKSLVSQFWGTDVIDQLQEIYLNFLKSQFNKIGFYEDESGGPFVQQIKSIILYEACMNGVQECVHHALNTLNFGNITEIKSDLKPVVYCIALNMSRIQEVWQILWALYNSDTNDEDRKNILISFGCIRSRYHLEIILNILTEPYNRQIRDEDIHIAHRALTSSYFTVSFSLDYIIKTINRINIMMNDDTDHIVANLFVSISSAITSDIQIQQVHQIYANTNERKYGKLHRVTFDFLQFRPRKINLRLQRMRLAFSTGNNAISISCTNNLTLIVVLSFWLIKMHYNFLFN